MPLSTRTMQPVDWKLIRHFTPSEFKYPARLGYQFMLKIDATRDQAGVAMHPTSDWRDPVHNKKVGGAQNSAHTDEPICEALDFAPANSADRYAIVAAAFLCGWERIGIYQDGSVHLDATGDRRPNRVLWVVVSNPA